MSVFPGMMSSFIDNESIRSEALIWECIINQISQ